MGKIHEPKDICKRVASKSCLCSSVKIVIHIGKLFITNDLLNVNTNKGVIAINIPTDNLFNAKLLTKVLELSYANVPTVCSVTPSNSNK